MRVNQINVFGTSHSEIIGCTVKGLPKGFSIDVSLVENQLALRQCGIGRSERQRIENNEVFIDGGLDANNRTNGKPLTLYVRNGDSDYESKPPITALRPSHADFVGCVKYGLSDARYIAEISSGRNTLPFVLAGAVCRQILQAQFGIKIYSHTVNIGGISAPAVLPNWEDVCASPVRCADAEISLAMQNAIEKAREDGDSLGGITQVVAYNLPIGFGEFEYSEKLQSVISALLMAIPSVKGIEFGQGFAYANLRGSQASERLSVDNGKIHYATNYCGGTIGGLATGQPLVISLAVKPVPSVKSAKTVDILTKQEAEAHFERSDTCVVQNVGIIAENMLAIALIR